ncbi:HPr family phosphocarrier protein [Brevibacillus sp. SYP-B805]|uniref:HPr family phosphocarrier protein n=1 Tax=Brevibacillus sp. SYP-B805 TaxID=1578199 RepID=UPI0013EDE3AB|nr:HPr family phosphocarrier protein [Brevibacillus sp. SYP-B805]NGQ96036.1 HPr family phosphocarrier protein [Brevibacillus sp. SYP-B805]
MEKQVIIRNKAGLHARPATLFVKTAGQFQAEITVQLDQKIANAKSIMNIMTLSAKKDSVLTLRAEGPDAAEALETLAALVESKFGEE